jgi:hypothetical protein
MYKMKKEQLASKTTTLKSSLFILLLVPRN